jgi:hypothetical protein
MRAWAAVALTAVALAGVACGDDAEDEARAQVCEARDEITAQVDQLEQLTPATLTADAVSEGVEEIRRSLENIGDAREDLGDDRREEIESATEAFTTEVRDVGSTILQSTSVEEARSRLGVAVDQLVDSYRSTLARIDCD